MANTRPKRESSRLPTKNWTNWTRAMVPKNTGKNFEERGANQFGYMCENIRSAFPKEAKRCGIYEWQARGTPSNKPRRVVYVGSTCRAKPGSLRDRIIEYCTSGSHKDKEINGALRKGYELWVRVKASHGKDEAQRMENELLDKYDYAWNERRNVKIRKKVL